MSKMKKFNIFAVTGRIRIQQAINQRILIRILTPASNLSLFYYISNIYSIFIRIRIKLLSPERPCQSSACTRLPDRGTSQRNPG